MPNNKSQKKNPQKKSPLKQDPSNQNDEILKYEPLVKNIASYFSKMNSSIELEDAIQEGWYGLLMAKKRFDPSKNVSLGAFARLYIFGRIYRSLIGTKRLQHERKILLLDIPEKIEDKQNETEEFVILLQDHINFHYTILEIDILIMVIQNYKKSEITKKYKITNEFYDELLLDFKNKLT
jgi:RNA polymerase sigma factor (sigma-70 family)